MDEGHALSRVLTPGADSRDDWKHDTENFAAIAKDMLRRLGAPVAFAFFASSVDGEPSTAGHRRPHRNSA